MPTLKRKFSVICLAAKKMGTAPSNRPSKGLKLLRTKGISYSYHNRIHQNTAFDEERMEGAYHSEVEHSSHGHGRHIK